MPKQRVGDIEIYYEIHGRGPQRISDEALSGIAVAHNVMGQDRRLVAVGRDGKTHPATWSSGFDGAPPGSSGFAGFAGGCGGCWAAGVCGGGGAGA